MPLPVCVMYSFRASLSDNDLCIGMNDSAGLRTNAMKNRPASRWPKPSEPSVKL